MCVIRAVAASYDEKSPLSVTTATALFSARAGLFLLGSKSVNAQRNTHLSHYLTVPTRRHAVLTQRNVVMYIWCSVGPLFAHPTSAKPEWNIHAVGPISISSNDPQLHLVDENISSAPLLSFPVWHSRIIVVLQLFAALSAKKTVEHTEGKSSAWGDCSLGIKGESLQVYSKSLFFTEKGEDTTQQGCQLIIARSQAMGISVGALGFFMFIQQECSIGCSWLLIKTNLLRLLGCTQLSVWLSRRNLSEETSYH